MRIETVDFQGGMRCPICKNDFNFIGNLDNTKEFDSNVVKVDETCLISGQGSYTSKEYPFELEVIVTCPACNSKIKTESSTRVLD